MAPPASAQGRGENATTTTTKNSGFCQLISPGEITPLALALKPDNSFPPPMFPAPLMELRASKVVMLLIAAGP